MKDIYIQFDTTKTSEYQSKNYISYIIIGSLIIVVLVILYSFYKKNKLNNEIWFEVEWCLKELCI